MTTHTDSTSVPITRQVDVAIIGAGTAGQNAFRAARKSTKNIVIINAGFWTTTCATVGCMPSKLLIAAANRAHEAKDSVAFGIHAEVKIDGKQVMARVQSERNRFASFVEQQVESWSEVEKISGRARINQEGIIEVNNERIKADKIIIATGSTPFIPDGWTDKLGERLLTSDTIFELTDLPKSLAVIGAGAIGLELAQAFSRLGVAITLFNRVNQVGGLKDEDINQKAIDCLGAELTMQLNSQIEDVGTYGANSDNNNEKPAAFINYIDSEGQAHEWCGEYVLVATGRQNTIDQLGIENLGVSLDDKNRPQNLDINTGQIGNLEVYIIGDANAHLPLLHIASDEGFNAGSTVCEDNKNAYIRPPTVPLSIVFCEPQIMTVGMSLPEIQEAALEYVIGKVSFDNQGRSRVMGVNCGLLHIYGCKQTDKILGASMVGPDAEYVAHILAVAITNDLSIKDVLDTPFYHPTILEGLRTALRDVQVQMSIPHQKQGIEEDSF
ncbi:dihydrolipoyl dehydrogenase [Psychrobacter urativorans]|uniref:Dihydrolipoamide dehydrogenase n=1 Tax=Psychrobacter urativorans TaxID=45610 RepID=A0A0M5TIT9_9GAMM|nr:dihydrolipoyl dehydrogenase [Psychrobacter urativorans]ALF60388.1 dihydrolipoamide dehydrogenase [Psychrobacter urativorans]